MFLLVPVLGITVFALAINNMWPMKNHWFPVDVSEHGHMIDGLFNFILYLTGAIFVGTGMVLFWVLWKYDAERVQENVMYTHGSHTLEVVWSILPAATLLFIAIYQMDTWHSEKMAYPMLAGVDNVLGTDDDIRRPPIAEVTGRQFEWRIRYPGEDGVLGTRDDLFTVNDLHIPVGEETVITIKSQDVLHSFFLPNFRLKQDLVPGMKQQVWFTPTTEGEYDIVCAELCGWGHYKMRGRITVESRADYEQFIVSLQEEQQPLKSPIGQVAAQ